MYGIVLFCFLVAQAADSIKCVQAQTDPVSNSSQLNVNVSLNDVVTLPKGKLLCLSLLSSSETGVFIPEKYSDEEDINSPAYLPLSKSRDVLYYFGTILRGTELEVRLFCNYHNMKLVSIESLEESDVLIKGLSEFLGESQSMKFWTSGKKYGEIWAWDSTGRPAHYTNWGPGQPIEILGKKTCIEAVLDTTAQTLLWRNMDCGAANFFICETPIES